MRLRYFGTIVALLIALAAPALFGQETTAGIQGIVRDPSGAVIPQANVEVASPALIGVKKMDTEQGAFRFVNLPPGTYTVTASAKGFRTVKKTDIVLQVGHLPTVDITMEVGAVTETVEVSAEAALIDPSQSKVQTNVTNQALMDLPTQSLSYQSVIQFAPGARYEPLQNNNGQYGGANNGFQINGASNSENSYLVDGQETASIQQGRSNVNVPMDFIQEVQVKSSGFEAEYGGALGGVVNVISKRGSNDWHGSAFLYYGSDKMNAGGGNPLGIGPATQSGPNPGLIKNPSYSANFGGQPRLDQPYEYYYPVKDHTRVLDPGFSLGGSVVKDRLWTFLSFAPDFYAIGRPVNVNYNNVGMRTFNYSSNTYYSLARLDFLATQKIRLYGSWQYNFNRAQGTALPFSDDIHGQLNANAGNNPDNYNNGIGSVTPNVLYNTGADITISPTVVATTRYSYWAYMDSPASRGLPTGIRYVYTDTNYSYGTGIPGLPTTKALDGTLLPTQFQQPAGYSNIGANSQTAYDWWRRYGFNQDLAWFKAGLGGRHNFKFGYAFNHGTNNTKAGFYNTADVYVAYNQQYIPNSQIGIANCQAIVAQNLQKYGAAGGNTDGTGCQGLWGTINVRDLISSVGQVGGWNHSFYAQDAWTVGKYLTLNVGVRLDKENLPSYDNQTGFQGISFGWGSKVAPRLGASYDLLHNGKLKVYGSFGYFFDIMKYNLPLGSFGGAYWHDCVYALDSPNYTGVVPQRDAQGHYCPTGGGNTPAIGSIPNARFIENYDYREPANDPNQIGSLGKTGLVDPNLAPMKQHVTVIGAAWEISRNLVFEPIYTRSRLDRTIEDAGVITSDGEIYYIVNPGFGVNKTVPACPGCSPNPKAIRRYDGLELRLTKRFSDSWFGAFSYTYSSNTGNYAGLTATDISDSIGRNNANTERAFDEPFMSYDAHGRVIDGPLPTDRPHAVKANVYYTPSFRKLNLHPTIGLFQTVYSGTPLSSYISVWGAPVFVEGRGKFVNVTRDPSTGNWIPGSVTDARTPHFAQSDLSLSQDFHVSKSNERMIARVGAECLNCFNQHHVTLVNQNMIRTGSINPYTCGGSVTCTSVTDQQAGFNYSSVLKGYDYIGLSNSQSRTLNSLYGLPYGWQAPRTLRLTFRFTF